MAYRVRTKLDNDSAQAIATLKSLYADDEWAVRYIEEQRFRCADDIENILSLGRPEKILNIGGAPYIFEAMAKTKGLVVDSLDLDPDRHEDVIKTLNLNVEKIDIEDADERIRVRIDDYDVLVLAEVLEHMRTDIIGTLKFLRDGLREEGYLYLTTPNFFYLSVFIDRIRTGRSGPGVMHEWSKLKRLGHMGHVREYSRAELVELFNGVGFEIVDIKHRNEKNLTNEQHGMFVRICCRALERIFNRFAKELVFVLQKRTSL